VKPKRASKPRSKKAPEPAEAAAAAEAAPEEPVPAGAVENSEDQEKDQT
jgi:hypothetical protein